MDVFMKHLKRVQYKQILLSTNREAKGLEKLSHPNIVKAYKYMGRENNDKELLMVILIMSKVNGPTIAKYVKDYGPIPEEDAIHYLKQLVSALQHMREKEMIHRDINPNNIMLRKDKPVLIDFGCSKVEYESCDFKSELLGTRGYYPPEYECKDTASEKSDIYGLGCTAFYMISGVHPNEIPKVTNNKWKSIGECLSNMPDYSQVIKSFIEKAVYLDTKQRASLDELSKLLEEPIMPTSSSQNIKYFGTTKIAAELPPPTRILPVTN